MKKIIVFSAACAALSAFGQSQSTLPYGNFGLDYACSAINSANAKLESETGASFFFDYYAVLLGNPYGGDQQGTNYTAEMLFGLNFDLEKQIGWRGGSFTISGAYDSGANLSNKIGNYFTVSESFVTNGALFYELYFSQQIESSIGAFTVDFGRISMSDTFIAMPFMGNLVSGGIDDAPASVFSNTPFTSSPTATWGVSVQYSPTEQTALAAGLYQAPQKLASSDWNGTQFGIHSNDGYMAMFQAQWSPEFFRKCENGNPIDGTGLAGIYQVGGYFFGGYDGVADFSGGNKSSGYGFWAQAWQMFWRDENLSQRYAGAWVGVQYSPVMSTATMPLMLYAGVQLQGFIPTRTQDAFYFSWLYGSFNSDYGAGAYSATYEMAVEATYVIVLNENISIQPDMQYIFRPNGNDDIDDALVLGAQLVVSF